MDKKEMPTSVLIPRLLQSMKHLLPRIVVAVCFAVLGQVVTIAIPVTLVYLAFDALTGNPAPLWTLGILILLALLRGAFRYYVPQVPQIFRQTIRENLLLGRTDVSDEVIMDLAEKCHMKERILAAPQGLDTLVEASDFSAGERQRLELMRALLKNADCYIFDEPTSNLDSLNEARFIQLVKEHCQGMVFLISHRSSTMACADVIFRLEDGQLVKEK